MTTRTVPTSAIFSAAVTRHLATVLQEGMIRTT